MDPNVIEILSSIYLWVIVVSVIGGYIALRVAGRNRDKAAFADYPDEPETFILRARIWYAVFIIFLLAMIGSLGIVIFQVLQITRPAIPLPFLTEEPDVTLVLTETEVPASPTPTLAFRTATPAPTRTPTPLPTATVSAFQAARIGNTDFQGANVRESPSLDAPIVAKLRNGTPVFLTERATVTADDYVWQQIRLEDGSVGWIVVWFLIVEESAQGP
jgi:hypothetical protein